jgi:hypothetical protein
MDAIFVRLRQAACENIGLTLRRVVIAVVAVSPLVAPTPAAALFPGQDKLDQCMAIGYVNELCPKIQQNGAAVALAEHPYRASHQTGFHGYGDNTDIQARMTALMPQTKGCTAKIVDPAGPR